MIVVLITGSFSLFSMDNDSLRDENYWLENDDFWFDTFDYWRPNPFIDISTGMSTPYYDDKVFTDDLAKLGNISAKFGFHHNYFIQKSKTVFKQRDNYLSIQNFSKDLPLSDSKIGEVNSSAWRLGIGSEAGYGYDLGNNFKIIFTNGGNIGWTWLKFSDTASNPQNQSALDVFGDDVRFGNQVENNVKIMFLENVGVNAGFERTLVYPRHMFWYWAGSELIFQAGNGLVDMFVKAISRSTPDAAPIVYLILHSAYNYGMYELRKDKMNWPFETATPYMFDTFKFGLSFKF